MKHKVKVQYVVEVDTDSQKSAIRMAGYGIPVDTTNIHVECWTPPQRKIAICSSGDEKERRSVGIAPVSAGPPIGSELCPSGCGHPVSDHCDSGCIAHITKGSDGGISGGDTYDYCPCDWKVETVKAAEPIAPSPILSDNDYPF